MDNEKSEVKIGSRNSRRDAERLQSIHDFAVENGAVCSMGKAIDPADVMVSYGGEVKALENGKIGGYLVRFSSADDPDLTGEYFTPETDFGEFKSSPVLYHHGMDVKMGRRRLGAGELRKDDVGVWIEAQLELRDEYERAVYEMALAGKLGWSSGTAGHLVEQKGNQITAWPLGLDASLTPTPAEPRNGAIPLKSLITSPEDGGVPSAEVEQPKVAVTDATPAPVYVTNITNSNEVKTMELTQEQLADLINQTAIKAVEEFKKAEEPATIKAAANVEVVRDAADQPFASDGEFFQAVKNAALYPNRTDARLLSRSVKASGMSEGTPADGGYLVQSQTAAGIEERMYKTGEILSRIQNLPIGPNSNGMIFNAVDETSRATGSRWGGVRGYWLAEAGTKASSKPKFRQVELKLKKVAALCYATDELLQDATALAGWINRVVPEELKFQVEDAIFEGDGVGKPYGIMSSTALVTVTRDTGSTIVAADILNMWGRRWAGVNDYVWLVNQDAALKLPQMTIGQMPVYLPPGGLNNSGYGMLLGRPVIETEYNATLNTTGDIMLLSPSQYLSISKGGIQSASSIHVQFLTDETVFRFVYRFDGAPLWHSALTPFKGSNTQSPYVVLGSAT